MGVVGDGAGGPHFKSFSALVALSGVGFLGDPFPAVAVWIFAVWADGVAVIGDVWGQGHLLWIQSNKVGFQAGDLVVCHATSPVFNRCSRVRMAQYLLMS